MRTWRRAILAALLLPVLGHAAYSIDHVSISCSSSLTQSGGDALSYSCDGNLVLQGVGQIGILTSDTAITLAATGNLTLDELSLIAPLISLQTVSGDLSVSADTRFFSGPNGLGGPPSVNLVAGPAPVIAPPRLPSIDIHAGAIVTMPGSPTLNFQTAVPEPSASLLVAFGLAGMAWLRRKH